MTIEKKIGWMLITGAIGVFIPYTILTIIFDYPGILRRDAGTILTSFHAGGSRLIFTWWIFAMPGIPLLIAYSLIGQWFENKAGFSKWVTTTGVISGIVQIIGLLRWVFVVPVIAGHYMHATDPVAKQTAMTAFDVVHQFGGVLLGEHLGQLFTIAWTVMMSSTIIRSAYFPTWVGWFGIMASAIYFLAQGEIFATVIPRFPAWDMAGLFGSTGWLIWLTIVGVKFIQLSNKLN